MRNLVYLGAAMLAAACGGSDDGAALTEGEAPDGGPLVDGAAPDGGAPDGRGPAPDGQAPGDDAGGSDGAAPVNKPPRLAGCDVFPGDNPWNQDVTKLPASKQSPYLAALAPGTALHPDWGTFTQEYGIPITTGSGAPPVRVDWSAKWGPTESDKVPCAGGSYDFCYPIPSTGRIEGGGGAAARSDRHLLYLDTSGAPSGCTLYELYNAQNWQGPDWTAANGAVWHLGTNALRPAGWTSADAAGLPILPGLVRYDEIESGAINHAIRFTMNATQQAYIHPATHAAGDADASLPPMGLRLRLKAGTVVKPANNEGTVLVTALKKYGVILADNGSDWYLSGETHDGWTHVIDGILQTLGQIHGSDFEVVDTGPIAGH